MSGIRYNMANFKKAVGLLRRAASDGARQAMNEAAKTAALALVEKGFATSTDPYGNAWADKVDGTRATLDKSGTMRGSFEGIATAKGWRIFNGADYSGYHQHGTRGRPVNPDQAKRDKGGRFKKILRKGGLPARKMVPEKGNLGVWAQPILEAMRARFKAYVLRG